MANAAARAWQCNYGGKNAAVARTASNFHMHAVTILKTHISSNNDSHCISCNGNRWLLLCVPPRLAHRLSCHAPPACVLTLV